MNNISKQLKFDSQILPVVGNYDYDQYRTELNLMDSICRQSGIDEEVVEVILKIKQRRSDTARVSKGLPPKLFSNDTKIPTRENAQLLFRRDFLRNIPSERLPHEIASGYFTTGFNEQF